MSWLHRQLAVLSNRGDQPAVVIDPEGLTTGVELAVLGTVHTCRDWRSLRRSYELYGRRPAPGTRPVLLVQDETVSVGRDLPWDIEQRCRVVVVSWPTDGAWRDVIRAMGPALADLVIEIVGREKADSVATTVLRDGFGVVLPTANESDELNAVARLRIDPSVSDTLWPLVRPLLSGRLARALAGTPADTEALQHAWDGWLRDGAASEWATTLAAAAPACVSLITNGLIRRAARSASDLPPWVAIGTSESDPADRLRELLDHPPTEADPTTPGDWIATAAWWGDVRAVLAVRSKDDELTATAWAVWQRLDEAFRPWLTRELGLLLTRQAPLPLAVNQIAGFLSRRVTGTGAKVMLVVFDGMAFAQWSVVRQELDLDVVEGSGCFAMCPTLTSVSRQAIFAGSWPADYADSLWTTAHEQRLWAEHWRREGLDARQVHWMRTGGRDASEVPYLPDGPVVGLVVLATDELMHGSDVNGDAQVRGGLETWLRFGFLRRLLESAQEKGFEVWITADHGNLEAVPSGRVMEGLRVDHAGTRARIYDTRALRDAAKADGLSWDPPGHPVDGKAFLFAPGRTGYHSGGPKVTHGGLSVDEVIVPFARVGLR